MKLQKIASVFTAATITASMAYTTVFAQEPEALSEETTKEVSENLPEGADIISYEPQIGDRIWVTDEKVTYTTPNKRFAADLSAKILYEIYIIDRYDEHNWRVHVPMLNEPERVLLLDDSYNIGVLSHDEYVLGDLCHDGIIDTFDLCLLRDVVLEDFSDLYDYSDIDRLIERSWRRQLADVNSDSEVSVADLVCMSEFLLGNRQSFR